jgi:hypothetical protein
MELTLAARMAIDESQRPSGIVIPAQTGIQACSLANWIPAFAGMTDHTPC